MSKMIRVNVLVLLTLVLSYGGIANPSYALLQCPDRFCSDLYDFCSISEDPECRFIRLTYLGECDNGDGGGGPMYSVSCASCSSPGWSYCYLP
jgi:hypothetical protein